LALCERKTGCWASISAETKTQILDNTKNLISGLDINIM
jgi:hypothetical protein